MTRDHLHGDPPSARSVADARRHVRAVLARELRPLLVTAAPDRVVGTSKTFRSLARVAGAAPRDDGPYVARSLSHADVPPGYPGSPGWTVPPAPTCRACRLTAPAQLLGGALVAEAALDLLAVDALTICPWALREGIILRRLDHLA